MTLTSGAHACLPFSSAPLRRLTIAGRVAPCADAAAPQLMPDAPVVQRRVQGRRKGCRGVGLWPGSWLVVPSGPLLLIGGCGISAWMQHEPMHATLYGQRRLPSRTCTRATHVTGQGSGARRERLLREPLQQRSWCAHTPPCSLHLVHDVILCGRRLWKGTHHTRDAWGELAFVSCEHTSTGVGVLSAVQLCPRASFRRLGPC